MKNTAVVAASAFEPARVLWTILAGELAAAAYLLATDRVPAALLHALQLFLRF
jgi:hypothetical protein